MVEYWCFQERLQSSYPAASARLSLAHWRLRQQRKDAVEQRDAERGGRRQVARAGSSVRGQWVVALVPTVCSLEAIDPNARSGVLPSLTGQRGSQSLLGGSAQ